MPKIIYHGEEPEVEVPSLGVVVKKGEAIDVEADVVDSFLAQTDNWKPSKAKETDK